MFQIICASGSRKASKRFRVSHP